MMVCEYELLFVGVASHVAFYSAEGADGGLNGSLHVGQGSLEIPKVDHLSTGRSLPRVPCLRRDPHREACNVILLIGAGISI